MMTARDPYVNVMRGAAAAFSAGLGGADSFSVLPHTLAAGFPDSLARRLARNAQLILLREANLGFVADPAAGAGAFEALTQALCNKAWELFQDIERQGGLPSALASGVFQGQVALSAAALATNVARLKTPITGVSAHADLAERRVELAVGAPEREVLATAEGGLAPIRLAEPFERLRDLSDALLQRTGDAAKGLSRRAGAGGQTSTSCPVRVRMAGGRRFRSRLRWRDANGRRGGRTRLRASGARLVCLCGTDDAYAEQAESFAKAFKASGSPGVALAGRPGESERAWRAAGVDEFIFAGGDAVATLQSLYGRISVPMEPRGAVAS